MRRRAEAVTRRQQHTPHRGPLAGRPRHGCRRVAMACMLPCNVVRFQRHQLWRFDVRDAAWGRQRVRGITRQWCASLLAGLIAVGAGVSAQTNTGELGGVVLDTSGGVLPGTTVVASAIQSRSPAATGSAAPAHSRRSCRADRRIALAPRTRTAVSVQRGHVSALMRRATARAATHAAVSIASSQPSTAMSVSISAMTSAWRTAPSVVFFPPPARPVEHRRWIR